MVGSGSINSKLKAGKSDEETQRRLKKMERDGSLGFEVVELQKPMEKDSC